MRIPCDISLIAQSILTLVILERECQLSYCSEKIDFKALCSQWNFGLFSCVKGRPRMVIKTLSLQTGCIKLKIASICAINQGDQTVQQFSRLLHHYKDWGNVSSRARYNVSRQNSAPISSHCYSAQGGKQASVYSFFHGIDFCLFC